MTAQQFMSDHVNRMGHSMAHFIATTKPELLIWTQAAPSSEPTRTALQLVGECVNANRIFAALLRGESPEKPGDLHLSAESAQTEIVKSSTELAAAINYMNDEDFEKDFIHPVRGPLKGKILAMGAYRNMAYHAGQINFIQILGGDHEFHLPPTWLK
jgi:hypothetical protein